MVSTYISLLYCKKYQQEYAFEHLQRLKFNISESQNQVPWTQWLMSTKGQQASNKGRAAMTMINVHYIEIQFGLALFQKIFLEQRMQWLTPALMPAAVELTKRIFLFFIWNLVRNDNLLVEVYVQFYFSCVCVHVYVCESISVNGLIFYFVRQWILLYRYVNLFCVLSYVQLPLIELVIHLVESWIGDTHGQVLTTENKELYDTDWYTVV